MPVVAVTGGIAAGKSVVCSTLAQLGAHVIDADSLARAAVVPGAPALEKIVETFGSEVTNTDGSLDRAALGARIFDDAHARAQLNAIVHPEVRRLYEKEVAEVLSRDPNRIIVYDIPLLAEARSTEEFDLVVVVDAPAEVRMERLQRLRGLSSEEAQSRIGAQASDEERRALADVIIDASGTEEGTIRQADRLYTVLAAHWPDRLSEVNSALTDENS